MTNILTYHMSQSLEASSNLLVDQISTRQDEKFALRLNDKTEPRGDTPDFIRIT